MKCFHHPGRDAVAVCSNGCGRSLCQECASKGAKSVCGTCLASVSKDRKEQGKSADAAKTEKREAVSVSADVGAGASVSMKILLDIVVWISLVMALIISSAGGRESTIANILLIPAMIWGFIEFRKFFRHSFGNFIIIVEGTKVLFFVFFFIYIFGTALAAVLALVVIPFRLLSHFKADLNFTISFSFGKKLFKFIAAWFGKWL